MLPQLNSPHDFELDFMYRIITDKVGMFDLR